MTNFMLPNLTPWELNKLLEKYNLPKQYQEDSKS